VSRRRWVALGVAGAALLGAAGLVGLAVLARSGSDRLLAALNRGLGRDVRAERVSVGLRHGLGVALSGVQIAEDPASTGSEPFLTARRFDLRLALLPLLRRRLVIDRILVEDPVVNLVRDRSGRLNVDSLGKHVGPAEAGAPAAERPAENSGVAGESAVRVRRLPAFQLASLHLRHGTIRYRGGASERTIELSDLALDARQPRFDSPVPVRLHARLSMQDLRLDHLSSDGVLDLAGPRPGYRGTLRAGPGTLGSLTVNRLAAEVRVAPTSLDVEGATLEMLGGTMRGAARVASEGPAAGLAADVDAHGLDLAHLPARKDRPHLTGALALKGTLRAPPPGASDFASGATGEGSFDVTEGRLAGIALGHAVLRVLAPLLGPGQAERLSARYPDLFDPEQLRFARLSGSGRLAEGRIRSDDLVLASASYEARGAGSLGLGGDVDLSLRLLASPALTDDLLGDSRARPILVDSTGRLAVPLRVAGPLRRPRVTPDPSFAAATARRVLGGRGLGKAAGDLLERLLAPKHAGQR
jgi:uncharacterized protein involved in outer membrane biogenesis